MSRTIPQKGYKVFDQQWSRSVGSLGFHVANLQACLNRAICSIRREISMPVTCCQLKRVADGCSYTGPILHLSLRRQEDLLLYDRDSHPEEPTKVVSLFHVIL